MYVLPDPGPALSARMLKVKASTFTMSLTVFPEPLASSASLLDIETKVIFGDGSMLSCAVTLILTVTYLWFGGHRELGIAVAVNVGGVVSTMGMTFSMTVTVMFAVPVLPALSVAFNVKT